MKLENTIFLFFFLIAIIVISVRFYTIYKIIKSGKEYTPEGKFIDRFKNLIFVAFGQSKMIIKPISGILHIFIYVGFIIINLEFAEIIIDGIFGTHRFIYSLIGNNYTYFMFIFEYLAVLVIFSCVIFLIRRNILSISRFKKKEIKLWQKTDANIILIVEILLMTAFLIMNGADQLLCSSATPIYSKNLCFTSKVLPSFWIGETIGTLYDNVKTFIFIERFSWWFHIIGVFLFAIYVTFSKHLHIFLAFPNVYYTSIQPLSKFPISKDILAEINALNSNTENTKPTPERFGIKDVNHLNWKELLEAFSCTECGRCTSECPANATGKLLSPRKIMMDVRKRAVEYFYNKNKKNAKKEKTLVGSYITKEEINACTSCNACVNICPININPLNIINKARMGLVLDESDINSSWVNMYSNIENNGAPWQFSQQDRANWNKK